LIVPSKHTLKAFDFRSWIEQHRELLKPPVGNCQIWEDGELIAMVIGGPNRRTDYHDDSAEEFFYQIEGDMVLRVMEEPGRPPVDVLIRAGEILLLPGHVRHSPQRPAGTIGLVIEAPRAPGAFDGFEWYCPQCHDLVYRTEVLLKSIVKDLPPLFERFYGDEKLRLCRMCGAVHPGKTAP
jgi:3-hydroxyanthranilate 3,4-dioxygenase